MAELAIVLEEGFDDDEIAVRVGNEVVFARDGVSTRAQVGYAKRLSVDVPQGDVDVSVDVPTRDVSAGVSIVVSGTTHLGVSLKDDQVVYRTSTEPFWYA